MTISHTMVFMWKEFGIDDKKFFSYWFPFLKLMQHRYLEVYYNKSKKTDQLDADDMNLDQLRAFFNRSGIPVKE